jgi:hypothetical protein
VLPDGVFSNKKYQFGQILEGIGMENVGIFMVIWNILKPYGKFQSYLVYFMVIWYCCDFLVYYTVIWICCDYLVYFFTVLVYCVEKNLATLGRGRRQCPRGPTNHSQRLTQESIKDIH